jgi:hypothetical protein
LGRFVFRRLHRGGAKKRRAAVTERHRGREETSVILRRGVEMAPQEETQMRRMFWTTAIAVTFMGCKDGECVDSACDTGGETDSGETDSDSDTDLPLAISASLTATGAELTITNGAAGDWFFGLSEFGTTDNWTGEDCNVGYDVGGTIYQWCHPSANTGVTLTKVTSTAWADIAAEMDADPTKTLFDSTKTAAFYVEDPTGACYVDNDTAGAYATLGCAAFP